jgi:hypothetical protein
LGGIADLEEAGAAIENYTVREACVSLGAVARRDNGAAASKRN